MSLGNLEAKHVKGDRGGPEGDVRIYGVVNSRQLCLADQLVGRPKTCAEVAEAIYVDSAKTCEGADITSRRAAAPSMPCLASRDISVQLVHSQSNRL